MKGTMRPMVRVRSFLSERAGLIWLVAQLANDLFDADADLGCDEIAAVDHTRDGGGADTGDAGDIANCGPCFTSHSTEP